MLGPSVAIPCPFAASLCHTVHPDAPCNPCWQNLEILASLRRELIRAGHLRPPRVFLQPSLPVGELPRLQRAVEALGGELAASEGRSSLEELIGGAMVVVCRARSLARALHLGPAAFESMLHVPNALRDRAELLGGPSVVLCGSLLGICMHAVV